MLYVVRRATDHDRQSALLLELCAQTTSVCDKLRNVILLAG